MFEELTRFIPEIEKADGHFGEWVHDLDKNGLPRSFSYVSYTKLVYEFKNALFGFYDTHPEYDMDKYIDIIKENGIALEFTEINEADCADKDAQCLIALLYLGVYTEKWQTGAMLMFYESGCILRWLKRLKEIDESKK